jgi:hypothetical protein
LRYDGTWEIFACRDLGQIVLDDVSAWTVSRAEVKAAAALIAAARLFFDQLRDELFVRAAPQEFNLAILSFRNDATNSAIWQKRSLNGMLLEASYLLELPGADSYEWNFETMFESISTVCDLQQVGMKSGHAAYGMLLKQFMSVGCPCIDEIHRCATDGTVVWMLYTGDRGPDVVFCKKIMAAMANTNIRVIFLSIDCFEHQMHLVVGSGLKIVDAELKRHSKKWKYYSSLAMFTNAVRNRAKDIYTDWVDRYGAADANQKVKSLFPTCNAGRWGSIETTEKRLDFVTSKIVPCYKSVTQKSKQTAHVATNHPDEISADATQHYTETMGRWERWTFNNMCDPLWWKTISAMHRCRGPLLHVPLFLRKPLTPAQRQQYGSHIVMLVQWKAEALMSEFSHVFSLPEWVLIFSGLNNADAQFLANLSAKMILHNASRA